MTGQFNYAKLLPKIQKVMKYAGASGVIVRNGTQMIPCIYVEGEYQPDERDGNIVQYTDRRVFVSPASIGDVVLDDETDRFKYDASDTDDHRIITVDRVKPATVNLLWELQVR